MNALRLGAVAQALLIWDLTGSTLSLGVVAAASALPMMLINVFGGVMADRFEAKNLLSITSLVGAALLVVLGVLDATDVVRPWHVFVIAILTGLISGADPPARQAYFPSLVPNSALKSAVTINGSLLASASIVAPTLGGLLIAATNTSIGFFVAAIGWFSMFVVTFVLPGRGTIERQRSVLRELTTGFNFIRTNRVLLVLAILVFSNMLMGFGWIGVLPAYVDRFGGGEREVGFVFSSAGVGAFTGILVAGRLSLGKHYGRVTLAAAALFSSVMLVVSVSPVLALGMALALIAHFGNGFFNISAVVAVQLRVPEDIRGRVMGVFAISQSVGLLGGLWTGTLANWFGIKAGMLVGPIILLMMISLIFVTQKSVRMLHENPELDAT
jgi:MFS family permease